MYGPVRWWEACLIYWRYTLYLYIVSMVLVFGMIPTIRASATGLALRERDGGSRKGVG
jgi:hypothetical protein